MEKKKFTCRTVIDSFWNDDDVLSWDSDTRYFFLYLITNPMGHYTGVFVLNAQFVSMQAGLTVKEIMANLKVIVASGKAFYDDKKCVIFVKNMYKYAIMFGKDGGGSIKQKVGAKNHFDRIGKTDMIEKFYETYPDALV